MEEDASSRRSVAELAGRFKDSAPPHDAAGQGSEKPVRRRPPRSLQLPKTQDQEEPPGLISPLPAKAKRNSGLIEKLQANLALSPSALLPSPKSPGFRLLPPIFPPPSPGSTPGTTVPTLPTPTSPSPVAASPITEEEGPVSFETPPTVEDGSILSNSNIKGRARHSIRRRPPSRRHRQSSSGEESSSANEGGVKSLSSPGEPEDQTLGGGEVFKQDGETVEVMEEETEGSTCPEKNRSDKDDHQEIREEEKEGGEEVARGGVGSSSGEKEEEGEAQDTETTDLTEVETKTDDKEEKTEETAAHSSVR
ncbi:duboraya [Antennarius striatus]|uniref:duboraya n=1 Tax=Antennarius striatus TaxID=241820 RepID=UPI0035B3BED0